MGSQSPLEPCLVQAGQGFSVSYKGRFLYSKYAPDRAIKQTIANLSLLEETLILAYSPCLWIGIKELLSKLPENCEIFAIEDDSRLFELSKHYFESLSKELPVLNKKVKFISSNQIACKLYPESRFRRVITLDLSGGAFFNSNRYKEVTIFCQNTINAFWKNRLTLVKLGRLFSRNFIRNLKENPVTKSVPVSHPLMNRPIIVFGAGESTEFFLNSVQKELLNNAWIIAVDAAFPVLQAHKIMPDFVVAVESQLAIEKAYIGTDKNYPIFLTDMASRKNVFYKTDAKNLYFWSEYADSRFLKHLEGDGVLPLKLPALGSVGLSATFLALSMRKNKEVPVFITGLDFSFSTGHTHVRGAPAHLSRLFLSGRFNPVENYQAAFKNTSKKIEGKNRPEFTDPALSGYGELFKQYFCKEENLFDTGLTGIPLNLPMINPSELNSILKGYPEIKDKELLYKEIIKTSSNAEIKVTDVIKNERRDLTRIKDLLSKGNNALPPPHPDLSTELNKLLWEKDYLYLHFPDGYIFNPENISFLKRVRSEIDFFLKDMK